ncbi:gamma-glutamylcyclotransferase family protein [Algoriphagus persicinus]|uniref:gamma-glutamylcyclotransferase family protein n=1 Tax=Algoriphagus persicinus TaxID=3108754 RepID=UPI002B380783|nr:gamma-glutamylcyclotransferase family protein [Algoriphagus sp. E1-3-M2]MEB2783016.1 gamma-glutamylcyclotransferase family protein [Algoriphagus sp. E1-3-M2]
MKQITWLMISSALLLLMGSCQEKVKIFKIPEGHVGMFGYGSLMSKTLIDKGLLDKAYDGPFLPAHLKGYKRSWTFAWPTDLPLYNVDSTFTKDYILIEGDTVYPKYLRYLNIREDLNTVINGVLYIVPAADLPNYDAWELGYERFEVTDLIQRYSIEGGPVFAYKALPDFELEPNSDFTQSIVELSYWEIIEDAFGYWGKDFEAEYKRTTEPFDPAILHDTQKILLTDPAMEKVEELKAGFKY